MYSAYQHAGFHLEIVPRRGETVIFLEWGARKGLDLKNNNTRISLKGARIYQEGASAPPRPLNETLNTYDLHV